MTIKEGVMAMVKKGLFFMFFSVFLIFLTIGCRHSPTAPTGGNGGGNGNGNPKPPEVWVNPDESMHQLLDYMGRPIPMSVRLVKTIPLPGASVIISLLETDTCLSDKSCFSFLAKVCVDQESTTYSWNSQYPMYLNVYWSADGVRPINTTPEKGYFTPAGIYSSVPISKGMCIDADPGKRGFKNGSRYLIFWGAWGGNYLDENGIINKQNGGSYVVDMEYITVG